MVILALLSIALCAPSSRAQTTPTPQAPAEQINPKLPTIFVVGDSTANNHANGGLGWGDPFITYFDLSKTNVLNRARGGRSSRTFISEGLWDKVLSDMKNLYRGLCISRISPHEPACVAIGAISEARFR